VLAPLTTLDVTHLLPAGLAWSAQEPEVVDEARWSRHRVRHAGCTGLPVAQDAALALDAEQRADVARTWDFVATHGSDAIFELATL